MIKTIISQRKAIKTRKTWEKENVHIPPFMIISVTNKCNLKCKGCYAQIHTSEKTSQLSEEKLLSLVGEACELGISIILLAGGEPFVRDDLFKIMSKYPQIIFPIFTNGLLIDDLVTQNIKKIKNIIPIISIEGYEPETDDRRGLGVYSKVLNTINSLNADNILFGTSITVTSSNFNIVTSKTFIENLINKGSKIFFFVEYVPVMENTEDLVLTTAQRNELIQCIEDLRKKLSAIFIAFPGDEQYFGGCALWENREWVKRL